MNVNRNPIQAADAVVIAEMRAANAENKRKVIGPEARALTRSMLHKKFAEEHSMKIASIIARYLIALVFIVFGLNGFLHFLPMKLPSSETAVQFFTALSASHYLWFVFGLQVIAGALFLFRRTVPLALTLAGPLIVNILLFHALMDPGGIVPGLVVTALWFVIFWQFRAAFYGIFFTESRSN